MPVWCTQVHSPVVAIGAQLEALGGRRVPAAAGAGGNHHHHHHASAGAAADGGASGASGVAPRLRWRFPAAGTVAAAPLIERLAALRKAHAASLWQRPRNGVLANLTLDGARRVVARAAAGGHGLVDGGGGGGGGSARHATGSSRAR